MKKSQVSELTSNPSPLQYYAGPSNPPGAGKNDRRPRGTSGGRQTEPDMERRLRGAGFAERRRDWRNPPLRTRLYPPIGRGAGASPIFRLWKRSGRAVQSWVMSGRVTGSWVPESWIPTGLWLAKWKPNSGWSWHLSARVYIRRSPPTADPGLLGGAGGRQQRWVSSERVGIGGGGGGRLETFCEVNQFAAAS